MSYIPHPSKHSLIAKCLLETSTIERWRGQPPGTPFQLKNLVNALVRVTEWFELGLQLGIEEYVLKRIEQDNRGQTERCKSDMLREWLINGLDHSWEEVDAAVEEVIRRSEENRRRDEEKTRKQVEERKTLEAISQIKKSLEKINFDECAEEERWLAKKLEEKNREWETHKTEWENQDEQWEKQKERRQQIREAIADRDLESEFVKRYLREKSVPTHISKEAVEACLREDMLQQEVVRVKELLTRRQDVKNHQTALTHLQKDSEKWIEQLEDHGKQFERDILSHLEQLGLKHGELRERRIQEHLKELGRTLRECKSAWEGCGRALEKAEHNLLERYQELHVDLESFTLSIQKLEQSSRGLKERTAIRMRFSGIAGIQGATVGALLRGTVGGFVGGPLGVGVGAAIGGVMAINDETLRQQNSQQLRTLNAELTAAEKIRFYCQVTQENVKQLLKTFGKNNDTVLCE